MAKTLKDILKQAHATINGVRNSTTDTLSLGKDPGVDYDPKAPAEQEFVAKHSVQKWDEPFGNPNYADKIDYVLDKEKKHGDKEAKSKKVYESKKVEDSQCNRTNEGVDCPTHGLAECMTARTIKEGEQIDELSSALYKRAMNRAVMKSTNAGIVGKNKLRDKRLGQAKKFQKAGIATEKKEKAAQNEETINEVLTKSTTAGETISDFVHSKNPKFAGKSPAKRKQMALAAYYSKQNEDLAMPLLGGTGRDDSDESAEMAKTQLKALANKALHLMMQMDDDMRVEPWVQAKIATAKELVSSVHDYMIYRDPKPKDEQMDTPMTFPNMSVDVNTGRNV